MEHIHVWGLRHGHLGVAEEALFFLPQGFERFITFTKKYILNLHKFDFDLRNQCGIVLGFV